MSNPSASWEDVARVRMEVIERREAEIAELRARVAELESALSKAVWAMRQPLDGWKGECERKALDAARAALGDMT